MRLTPFAKIKTHEAELGAAGDSALPCVEASLQHTHTHYLHPPSSSHCSHRGGISMGQREKLPKNMCCDIIYLSTMSVCLHVQTLSLIHMSTCRFQVLCTTCEDRAKTNEVKSCLNSKRMYLLFSVPLHVSLLSNS